MGVIVAKLYDLASNELADISPIALAKSLNRVLNGSRAFTIQAPAGHTLLTTAADDGYPNLRKGNRKLVVWEDGTVIFHGRVWTIERNGDGTENLVTITAYMPLMELGYDSNDYAGRVVRGSTKQPTAGDPYGIYDGNFITPRFASSVAAQVEISGPDLILQVLTNSLNTGSEGDTSPPPGEGPLPIDLASGTFDLDVPPAVDLSAYDSMDWPILIGDFIAQLVATGVVDVDLVPIDPADALDPYFMGIINAVSSQGSDRSGTVHFDYFTGSKNASACRHIEDFSTINNKLYDYLGPRGQDLSHWAGNITPGSPGVTVDPTDSRTLYGTFMGIRVYDSIGTENSSRPLYVALFNGELGYRIAPRDLLYVTPAPDVKALFDALVDYDVGDLIAINTGGDFGVSLAETQRVYGFTKTWDRQGVSRVSELLTSADPA